MKISTLGAAIAVSGTPAWAAPDNHMLLSQHGCGRATGYAEANKIVTVAENTHVAWLDSEADGFRVKVRTLDRTTGDWSEAYTIDEAYDNHGGPALTVDSDGYLHIAYYPHHHPMRYRKSLRPNDASAWTDPVDVGARATYPTLVCGPDDTLYLTFRVSSKEEPWWVDLYTKPKDADQWQGPTRILQADEGGYAHFMEALAWSNSGKTLHLSTRMHGGDPPRGHTVGYMKSDDGGVTWTKGDGSPIALPATSHTIDVIAQERNGDGVGLRAGSIAIGPDDRPNVLFSSYDRFPMDTWIAAPDAAGHWQRTSLRPTLAGPWADWGVTMPGGLTFSENGRLYITLALIRPESLTDSHIWGHPSCEIAVFESEDNGKSLEFRAITDPDSTKPRWLPSLERPTGHNRVLGPPGLIYTDGGRGENNREILANDVYWAPL